MTAVEWVVIHIPAIATYISTSHFNAIVGAAFGRPLRRIFSVLKTTGRIGGKMVLSMKTAVF